MAYALKHLDHEVADNIGYACRAPICFRGARVVARRLWRRYTGAQRWHYAIRVDKHRWLAAQ